MIVGMDKTQIEHEYSQRCKLTPHTAIKLQLNPQKRDTTTIIMMMIIIN